MDSPGPEWTPHNRMSSYFSQGALFPWEKCPRRDSRTGQEETRASQERPVLTEFYLMGHNFSTVKRNEIWIEQSRYVRCITPTSITTDCVCGVDLLGVDGEPLSASDFARESRPRRIGLRKVSGESCQARTGSSDKGCLRGQVG